MRTPEAALAAMLGALAVVLHVVFGDEPQAIAVDVAICVAAALAPRFFRVSALLVLLLLVVIVLPPAWKTLGDYAPLILVFTASRRGRWVPAALVTLAALAITAAGTALRDGWSGRTAAHVFTWLVLYTIPWVFGALLHATRVRHRRVREAALAAQRAGLARDIHDTAAHSLSLIAMRARQAQLQSADPDPALADIADEAGDALGQLRGLLARLRGESTSAGGPPPSLADTVSQCIADAAHRGFSVVAEQDVDPASVPEGVAAPLGRILVEAFNNLVKHGDPACPGTLVIRRDSDELVATLTNRTKQAVPAVTQQPSLGIVGMRERAEEFGGRFEAGPSGDRQWTTAVRFPLTTRSNP